MALKLLIVNFHYIRESTPVRGIYNITPERFISQLEAIYNTGFEFISLDDLHSLIRRGIPQRFISKACLITFDDGLRESYETGLSILDKKGIPAAFFLSGATVDSKIVLDVHKFHYIQSVLSSSEIWIHIAEQHRLRLDKIADHIVQDQYVWDDINTAKLKYLFNFLLNQLERETLIKDMFQKLVSSEQLFAENLYMSKAQIRDLGDRGFLGAHGNTHIPLANLSLSALQEEITESQSALSNISGQAVESISYPYGGGTAISTDVFSESKRHGFISGMTMIRGLNTEQDIIHDCMRLKRFDTNDVFGGKSEAMFKEYFNE